MLSPRGRPIGKFLGYLRRNGKAVGDLTLRENTFQILPTRHSLMLEYDERTWDWVIPIFPFRVRDGNMVEVRLTNDWRTLDGPTRLLIKERNRVAVYAVR